MSGDDFPFVAEIVRDTAPLGSDDPILARIMREMDAAQSANYAPAPADDGWRVGPYGTMEKSIGNAGVRVIHGLASTSTINSHKYALISRGMEADLPVPLLFAHDGHSCPIGEVFHVRRSESRIYVRAALYENEACDHAWRLIQSGEARCFSGAADPSTMKLQGIVDGRRFYGEWKLGEVSICRQGANPDCVFDIMSPGDDGVKFMSGAPADMRPSLPYAGTWKAGETYPAGTFITHRGALWHAEAQSRGVRPGESPVCWKLAAKAGKPVERHS